MNTLEKRIAFGIIALFVVDIALIYLGYIAYSSGFNLGIVLLFAVNLIMGAMMVSDVKKDIRLYWNRSWEEEREENREIADIIRPRGVLEDE